MWNESRPISRERRLQQSEGVVLKDDALSGKTDLTINGYNGVHREQIPLDRGLNVVLCLLLIPIAVEQPQYALDRAIASQETSSAISLTASQTTTLDIL